MEIGKTVETASFTVYAGWFFTRQFTASGTFSEQIRKALSMAMAAIAEAGATPEGIVKCDIVLRDSSNAAQVYEAYRHIVSQTLPAFRIAYESNLEEGIECGVELTGVTLDSGILPQRFMLDTYGVPASVRAGNYIYTSNQLPDTPGDFESEARQVVSKTVKALEAAGGSSKQAVKNFAMLVDINRFDDFNTEYAKTFTPASDPPARSLIGTSNLGGYQISLESIAYLGTKRRSVSIGALSGKMPFCSAMIAGDFLFVSGQIGILNMDGTYNLELVSQTDHMYRVIESVIAEAGYNMDSCLKYDGFSISQEYLPVMRTSFPAAGGKYKCAGAIYPVDFLANAAILVEMDLVVAANEE